MTETSRSALSRAKISASEALLEALRLQLEQRMQERSLDGHEGTQLVTTAVDQILVTFAKALGQDEKGMPVTGHILALGGYGRKEMSPHSDIDLLFLVAEEDHSEGEDAREAILHALWDLGFKVGHATRSQAECLALSASDPWSATAHSDARLVFGDPQAAATLKRESTEHIQEKVVPFLEDIATHTATRHGRFGDTVYHLEPNLKLGEGGLRDIQTARWAACAAFGTSDLDTLVKRGVIPARSAKKIQEGLHFLWLVRMALHLETGRKADRLTFATQDGVAVRLHYGDQEEPEAESLMQDLYLHMREIFFSTQRLFNLCLLEKNAKQELPEDTVTIPAGFRTVNGYLDVEDRVGFAADPRKLVQIFRIASEVGQSLHPDVQEEILAHGAGVSSLVSDTSAVDDFWEILTCPDDGRALLAMHDLKILPTLVPEFQGVTGLYQRNLFHAYTVDIHTLHGVCTLKRLAAGTLVKEHPNASSVMEDCVDHKTLFLAMLLHDIGKGRGGAHSEKGAAIAKDTAVRLGLSAKQAEDVSFLVEHHLDMALLSQQRDLSDPDLIEEFTQKLGSKKRLAELTLLTFADMASVNPEHLNEWREVLLFQLYRAVQDGMEATDKKLDPDGIRAEVREALASSTEEQIVDHAVLENALSMMPDNYLLSTSIVDVTRHLFLIGEHLSGTSLVVDLLHLENLGIVEATVVCSDAPGLLARIAGVFAANGLDIVSADVVSVQKSFVVDVFRVADPHGVLYEDTRRWTQVRTQLATALEDPSVPRTRLEVTRSESRIEGRVLPPVTPGVTMDLGASQTHTVIDVIVQDRLGVLFDITRVLYYLDLEISLSRVTTKGNEVHDTFYVRDQNQAKVTDPAALEKIREKLLEEIA